MGRFILIDHALVDFAGHHYEYARAVLDAAAEAGYEPVLATNRSFRCQFPQSWPVIPAFKYGVWPHQGAPAWQIALWRALKAVNRRARSGSAKSDSDDDRRHPIVRKPGLIRTRIEAARQKRFNRDTARLLARLKVAHEDLIFLPTLSPGDFSALLRLWRADRKACCGDWHLLFRRPPEGDFAEYGPAGAWRLRDGGPGPRPRSVRFWTDSDELALQYRSATGRPFGTLPIPHVPPVRAALPPTERLRILYLGDARLEKGFQYLPGLVRELTDNDRGAPRFEFWIQAHGVSPCEAAEIVAARAELSRLANRGVRLFTLPLSPAAYRDLLASGQIAVLPYDRRAYAERSSGVFAEALAAGIPLVVPQGTWMARQMPDGIGLAFQTVTEIAAHVLKIGCEFPRFAARARRFAGAWRKRHNAVSLVGRLTSPRQAGAVDCGALEQDWNRRVTCSLSRV